jgi:uncharacterized membrane protein YeaQ/YmgE (transglycosylase-associated protein family)
MNFIIWIILGALAGWIASRIMGTSKEQGFLMDVIIGIVGAFIGGFVMNLLGSTGTTGLNIWSIIVAVIGAVILLAIVKAFRRA